MAPQLARRERHEFEYKQCLPGLYKNGRPDKPKIAEFIGYKGGANGSKPSASLPWVIQKKARAIAEICELVAQGFNGDAQKAAAWFQRKSPWFGNTRPVDMILCDRCEKLKQFVLNTRDGHLP